MNHIKTCLQKYFVFAGRASRAEYWTFFAFSFALSFLALVMSVFIDSGFNAVADLISILLIVPSISAMVRRLHDVNKSGWWFFISLIPFIGWIWLPVLLLSPSQNQNNKY